MSFVRIAILITLVAALLAAAELSGVRQRLTLDGIRAVTAGPGGVLLFAALFVGAQVAHLPGMGFVAAAVVSWGPVRGGVIGWLGAGAAVCVTFAGVRAIGGKAPAKVSRPRLERLLAAIEKRPIRTVIALRLF